MSEDKIRLQKLLADLGQGSRRQIEQWIAAGRLTINGAVAQLGDKATAADAIALDGERLRFDRHESAARVLAYHKPDGEISTRKDPEGRQTVFERLPPLQSGRWIAIGRLDLTTSGILLFTTDGALANALMHPSHGVEREYAVRVLGEVERPVLDQLRTGVKLDDGLARFEAIADAGGSGANRWYHVILKEGRNHEVKRLWESQGFNVSRLIRVRYGPIELGRTLKAGHWRELDDTELRSLYAAAGLPAPRRQHPRGGGGDRRKGLPARQRAAAPGRRPDPAREERRSPSGPRGGRPRDEQPRGREESRAVRPDARRPAPRIRRKPGASSDR